MLDSKQGARGWLRCLAAGLGGAAAIGALGALAALGGARAAWGDTIHVAALQAPAQVVRDGEGVPHIYTATDHDAAFMLGWVHAQDRFFQMDSLRRVFSGTLAELLGQGALASDVQLRTLGLRRAAEESLPKYPAATVAWLQAYSDGVNAYVKTHPLPPEYGALLLTDVSVPDWSPLDSLTVAKGLAFQLSFDLGDVDRTVAVAAFVAAGQANGFDPVAAFFDDVDRVAPFDPTISIPGWLKASRTAAASGSLAAGTAAARQAVAALDPEAVALAAAYREKAMQVPLLADALRHSHSFTGSNWWVVSGALSQSGHPLLANDPHLSLSTPSVFYEVHLLSFENGHGHDLNVSGVSFPGTPAVVLGCNTRICWGATTNPMDVTDVYLEQLVVNPQTGLPSATLFEGKAEPLVAIQQTFRFNLMVPGHPDMLSVANLGPLEGGLTLVVPRRNNGPIVAVDTSHAPNVSALSVQYTGWRDTREIDSLLIWQRAANLDDFKRGLQYFHFGSQNWSYADVDGNIAYFTSGAQPLREDLQTLHRPDGTPPTFIRDGTHHFKNEWLPVMQLQPGQQLAYEILPFAEMPQVVNPPQGYVLTANNDPIGTTLDNNVFDKLRADGGIYYFGTEYSSLRSGQISRLLRAAIAAKGKLGAADLAAIQHNNQLLDADFFRPFIVAALANAGRADAPAPLAALAADPQVAAAVGRLAAWDLSTPTGIRQGYDPGDDPAALPNPSRAEVANSVAATLYTVWRSQFVGGVVDATLAKAGLAAHVPDDDHALRALKELLANFATNHGFGHSGLYFFEGTGPGLATAEDSRDLLILQCVRQALDQLAGGSFADAFPAPGNLNTLRWGRLHRIVFSHLLGGPFDIPGAGDLSDLAPKLPGVAKAGGFETIDAASFGVRVSGENDFMFGSGPARRFIGELAPSAIDAQEIIPGGESGVVGSPQRANQLGAWLTDQYHPLLITSEQVRENAVKVTRFLP
ncbi:MAG TPA: penicillin acylase family protein [Thermoanaerobaculia bacterium]|nr:penicillin acylase family protein [Thermoanaerobaculia bacterium]